MIIGQYNNIEVYVDKIKFTGVPKSPYIIVQDLNELSTSYPDYTDITSIVAFDKYSSYLLGTAFGFKDEKCIQREVYQLVLNKTNNDINANWSVLSPEEQFVVCKYCLSKVSPTNLVSTVPDPLIRQQLAYDYDKRNTMARGTWSLDGGYGRLQVLRMYLFSKLGTSQSLELLNDGVKEGVVKAYEDGIESLQEDGVPGLKDFLLATAGSPYDGSGTVLGLPLRNYTVIDGSGDTLQDVSNNCSLIMDGWY